MPNVLHQPFQDKASERNCLPDNPESGSQTEASVTGKTQQKKSNHT